MQVNVKFFRKHPNSRASPDGGIEVTLAREYIERDTDKMPFCWIPNGESGVNTLYMKGTIIHETAEDYCVHLDENLENGTMDGRWLFPKCRQHSYRLCAQCDCEPPESLKKYGVCCTIRVPKTAK
jgi:hypothetical protein